MQKLTSDQIKNMRPNDCAHFYCEVPKGISSEKLPWTGHMDLDVIQDLSRYWDVKTNHKKEWLAFLIMGVDSEVPNKYLTYQKLPEGKEKETFRTSLLIELTRNYDICIPSEFISIKKSEILTDIVVYYVPKLRGADKEQLRAEIGRSLTEPEYIFVTGYDIQYARFAPGQIVIVPDGFPEHISEIKEEIGKARCTPDYVPLVGFEIEILEIPLKETK